jgi:hypothetical protein
MRLILFTLLAMSSVSFAAQGEDEEAQARFTAAIAKIREVTEAKCETILDPASEPRLRSIAVDAIFAGISVDRHDWMATVAKIYKRVDELKPGQTLTIEDSDHALNQVQWEHLLKSMGLRILGLRSFNALNRIRALVEKIEPDQAIELQLADLTALTEPQKLELRYYKNRKFPELREVITRQHKRILAFPYYVDRGELFVLAQQESNRIPPTETMNEASGAGYFPEPIAIEAVRSENLERKFVRLIKRMMPRQFGLRVTRTPSSFYPSPDALGDRANALFIPLRDKLEEGIFDWEPMDAAKLLERAHWTTAGNGIFETNLYLLFLATGQLLPRWSGETIELENGGLTLVPREATLPLEQTKTWSRKRWFLPARPKQWQVMRAEFRELNSGGTAVSDKQAEIAVSAAKNSHLISLLPVRKLHGVLWVGLATGDFPAPQASGESSWQWTLPVMRLPQDQRSITAGLIDLKFRFERQFTAEISSLQSLGSSFRPDSEISADIIHPYVAELQGDVTNSRLAWFPLETLIANRKQVRDGRLLLSLLRLAHAEGLLH